jgi:hypothetical protein
LEQIVQLTLQMYCAMSRKAPSFSRYAKIGEGWHGGG